MPWKAVGFMAALLLVGCAPGTSGQAGRAHSEDNNATGLARMHEEESTTMNEAENPFADSAVSYKQSSGAPPPAPANCLKGVVTQGPVPGTPVVLHGYFNLSVEVTGRYRGNFPAPIHVVAVSRDTGQVFIHHLAREEDMPPRFKGTSAPPSVVLEGPNGPTAKGISLSGYFSVDLKRHLALPDKAGKYDLFLWLEDITSDVIGFELPAGKGDRPGGLRYVRPPSIARVERVAASEQLSLTVHGQGADRQIEGECGAGRVSLVALGVESMVPAWTVLPSEPGGGIKFQFKLSDLLSEGNPDERVVIFALADGKRSELLDSARGK